MKNQILLQENGINFTPFDAFSFSKNTKKCTAIIERYQEIPPMQLIGLLLESKHARHRLSPDEEREREQLTYALFRRLADYTSKPVDSDMLRKNDPVARENLKYNSTYKPVTRGSYSFIYDAIPTRFQRVFFQLAILCGRNVEISILRYQGFRLEIDAYKITA